MRVRTPNSRSRSWSLTVWTKSVALVVAALCMAFTEGQGPSVWQTGTTDEVLKAADDLAGPHLGQATVLDHEPSVRTDGSSGSLDQGGTAPGNGCGLCIENPALRKHYARPDEGPLATYGPSDHGWHDEDEWLPGIHCDFEHGICGGGRFARAAVGGLTDAIAQAAAEQDVALLATMLEQPDVHVNSVRGAIQVTSCDGTTIAGHVPVGRDLLEAAEVLATEALHSES